ncbi:MFS transporter [Blastomonas sp.]|uniref:MFS transporter n=1 Tax=Blastomonas sp. TaxID=1909299 RepID=UPI0026155093|nr:MFS transporter [Blastomonas sp.]MDM7955105.1 MFS transporter [Blastomonas sp.]
MATVPLPATPQADWPSSGRSWFAVAVLTLGYVFSFIDRTILSLMVDPIKADLGLSDTEIALLQGLAFGLFFTVMALPIGWLVDRVSRKRVIGAGVTVWCLATAACGLASSFWHLFFARMAVGAGEACLSPSAISMIGDNFPPEKRAFPISVYSTASSVGAGLALMVGGTVIGLIDSSPEVTLPFIGAVAPWQATFIIVGLAGLVVVLLLMLVTEPVRREIPIKGEVGGGMIAHVRRHPAFHMRHLGGMALYCVLIYGVLSWMPAYFMRSFGWGAAEVGLRYGFVVLVFGGFGLSAAGWLASHLALRGVQAAALKVTGWSILLVTPFMIAACLAPSGWIALAILAPGMVLFTASGGIAVAALCEAAPGTLRGQVAALYFFTLGVVGLSIGPVSVALITEYVFDDPDALGAAIAVAAGIFGPLAGLLVLSAIKPFNRAALALAASTTTKTQGTVQ